jgi:hypothetical protein
LPITLSIAFPAPSPPAATAAACLLNARFFK